MSITLEEVAHHIGAQVCGAAKPALSQTEVQGIASLADANQQQISFLANKTYAGQLADSDALAVIVHPDFQEQVPGVALVVENPYLGFARATQLFDDRPQAKPQIDPTAVIDETAIVGDKVSISANVVIGAHCSIGDGCEIGANTYIGPHSSVGQDAIIAANVTITHNITIGDRVRLHPGAVIGADGFGFAPQAGGWEKIAQLGGVRIGDDCEIGANTCIDRGALNDTVIGNQVIIDNLVQIAHNVVLGDGCALAACSGVAGSTTLGKQCTIGGGAGIAGHLTLADGVHVGAMALISKSINSRGAFASGTAQMPMAEWRRSATRFRQLDDMAKRIQKLEKQLKEG